MVLRMRAGARLAKTLEAENAETERIMKNGPDPKPESEPEQSDAVFQTHGNTWTLPNATSGNGDNDNDADQAPVNSSIQTPYYETYVDNAEYSDDFDEEDYEFDNDG